MSLAATVSAMAAAGCTAQQIAAVVEAHEAAEDAAKAAKRAKDAARKRSQRERDAASAMSRGHCVTSRDGRGHNVTERDDADVIPQQKNPSPDPSKKTTPLSSEPSVLRCESARRHVWPDDFAEQVWRLFPRKTEKQAGMAALAEVHRRDRLSWAELTSGIRSLCEAVEEPKFAPALHRWLKRERWQDQHPVRAPPAPARNTRSLIDGLDEIERRFADVPAADYPRLAG